MLIYFSFVFLLLLVRVYFHSCCYYLKLFIWYLVCFHALLVQGSDGGYGGGPGQVSIYVCFLKMCGSLSFHEIGLLEWRPYRFILLVLFGVF